MASIVVPGLDLAPSVPSRIVTVDVIDMTEGAPAVGAKIDFILPQDLHATSDGKVLKAGTTTLELDANGHGEIRVPAYSTATSPEDWVILVKKHWAPYPYPIRVPAGASKISLASLEPPMEVNDNMAKYLLTDAAATIQEGAQWSVNVETQGNIANFKFTAPPGGEAYSRLTTYLTVDSDIESLAAGVYAVPSGTVATALGLPEKWSGVLVSSPFGAQGVQQWTPNTATGEVRTYQRGKISAGWQAWTRLATESEVYWRGTTALTGSEDRTALPSGVYTVWNTAIASALGLPGTGVLTVAKYGSGAGQGYQMMQTLDTSTVVPQLWLAWRGSAGWTPWTRLATAPELERAIRTQPTPRGFRTAALALTLGGGGADAPLTRNVRLPLQFAAPITRWRLHIQNVNPRSGVKRSGSIDFTGLWLGEHAGNGAFTSAPKQLAASFSTPSNGDEWVSDWFNEPIGNGTNYLLSYGYTASSAPWQLVGGAWVTSNPADAATTNPTVSRIVNAPMGMWIEAETYATTPVIAVAGDSLSCGVGASLPVFDSPISQYARAHGALPVHYAASGDSMNTSIDPTHFKWQQFTGTDAPDSILWAMGSNDVFAAGVTLTQMQERHAAYGKILASITPTLYAATITPRTSDTSAQEEVRRTYNTWLKSQPNGVRDVFDFAAAISADDETIKPSFDSDGIHLTTTGYTAEKDAITRPICAPAPIYS